MLFFVDGVGKNVFGSLFKQIRLLLNEFKHFKDKKVLLDISLSSFDGGNIQALVAARA